jgi:hypothetical protein
MRCTKPLKNLTANEKLESMTIILRYILALSRNFVNFPNKQAEYLISCSDVYTVYTKIQYGKIS